MNRSLLSLALLIGLFAVGLMWLISRAAPTEAQTIIILTPDTDLGEQPMDEPMPHPGDILPHVAPVPLPVIPGESFSYVITDEQYLSGFSLDAVDIQNRLVEIGSVLGETELQFNAQVRLPAAEALSTWSSLYTISPAVLLTMAEVEYGLLSRSVDTPLSEEEIGVLSAWFPITAAELATRFYEVYNGEAALIDAGMEAQVREGNYINAGTYAIDGFSPDAFLERQSGERPRDVFVRVFTTYFGSPTLGDLHVDHPGDEFMEKVMPVEEAISPGEQEVAAPRVSEQVSGPSPISFYKFPWTGDDQWNYNGGPHRPFGNHPLASLDFQPGNMNGCNPSVATNRYVTAAASGRIVQNGTYIVTIDHDLDGNRATGSQSQYYHLANNTTAVGTVVKRGHVIGNPSCNDADGVHVHFSQLVNNAYVAVDGRTISGWTISNGTFAYHGYLRRAGYPDRQSGPRPNGYNYDAADTVLKSDSCGIGSFFAEYYNGRLPVVYPAPYDTCVSNIMNSWGSGGPGNGIGNDNFSARWVGSIPYFAGRYTFTARTDDGVRLWISGYNLVNYWYDQGATSRSKTVDLESGEFTLEMEYYENGGDAVAQLSSTRSNTTYHTISPLNSNKCMDVRGASTSNGAAVQQYGCNRSNAQFFYIVKKDGSYYELRNLKSGKCVDVSGYSTSDGALVHQWDCHGGYNQQWLLRHVGRQYFQIVSRQSGKCLDVPSASTADSVQLQQYNGYTGTNQLWTVKW